MTKQDLKVGDIVKLRNGIVLVIISNEFSNNGLSLFSKYTVGCYTHLDEYNDDLTHSKNTDKDIVAVYRSSLPSREFAWPLTQKIITDNSIPITEDLMNTSPSQEVTFFKWDWERKVKPKVKPQKLTLPQIIAEVLGYPADIIK